MKGYLVPQTKQASDSTELSALPLHEALAVDAVGAVIEFWGFKVNHGRVWALLYLRGVPLSAAEIQNLLGLSKGAVSMVTRELEQWKVIHRLRNIQDSVWRFSAETDFKSMIARVVSSREAPFLARVTEDLREAEAKAHKAAPHERATLERIRNMRVMAEAFGVALDTFIATARLDVKGLSAILLQGVNQVMKRSKK